MDDFGKLLRKSLFFSDSEELPGFEDLKNELIRFSVYKEVPMNGKGRILLALALVIAVVGVGLFLMWDKIIPLSSSKVISETKTSQEEVAIRVKQPQNINVRVTMAYGDVKVVGIEGIHDVEVGYFLKNGDVIQTGPDSECEVQVGDNGILRITENSSVSFSEIIFASSKRSEREASLMSGSVKLAFKKLSGGETFKVKTETAIAAVRGTKFSVSVDNEGKTKLVVTEGSVVFVPRISKLERIKNTVEDEVTKEKLSQIELSGGVIVKEGKKAEITPKEKVEAEKSVSDAIEKVEAKVIQGKVEEEAFSEVEKVLSSLKKKSLVKEDRAQAKEVSEIEKYVSKEVVGNNAVKVTFVSSEKWLKGADVYIDGTLAGKIPFSKMLSSGKSYKLVVEKDGEVVYSEDLKVNKEMKVEIRTKKEGKVETKAEKEIASKEEKKLIASRDIEFVPAISHSKIGVYSSDYAVVPSQNSVLISYGEKFIVIPTGEIVSMGIGSSMIAVVSKKDDDKKILKVFSFDGNSVGEFDISDKVKGLLFIGRMAVVSRNVVVPVLDGIEIINVTSGNRKFVNVGNTFSDVGAIGESVVIVNEIGEVYKVSLDGNASKIGQLDSPFVRKASILTHPDGSVYILYKGKLYSFGSSRYVSEIGVSEAFGAVYGERIVLNAINKVLVIDRKSGKIVESIDVAGKVNGIPYLDGNYLVITATDGLHIYDLSSRKEETYDVIGYASFIKKGKVYVIGKSKVFIVTLE